MTRTQVLVRRGRARARIAHRRAAGLPRPSRFRAADDRRMRPLRVFDFPIAKFGRRRAANDARCWPAPGHAKPGDIAVGNSDADVVWHQSLGFTLASPGVTSGNRGLRVPKDELAQIRRLARQRLGVANTSIAFSSRPGRRSSAGWCRRSEASRPNVCGAHLCREAQSAQGLHDSAPYQQESRIAPGPLRLTADS